MEQAVRKTRLCVDCGVPCRPEAHTRVPRCKDHKLAFMRGETPGPIAPPKDNNAKDASDAVVQEQIETYAKPTHELRIATLDIETSALNATFGRLICACFKFSDEDAVVTVRCPRFEDEPEALHKIGDLWDAADVIATWNGKRFDIPFINACRMYWHMDPLTHQKMHKDLLYEQRKLRFCGARLDNVSKDLRTQYQKHTPGARAWPRAAGGDMAAFEEIVKHCEFDVLLTEEMFGRLKPLILRFTK